MSGDTGDYLKRRAEELGLDRADVLSDVQAWLDQKFPGKARALSLNNGVLRIVTPSASVASELRLEQSLLLALNTSINKVSIRLG